MNGATMTQSKSDMMNAMEHAEDTIFVPPLVDERLLSRFCRAVQTCADAQGTGAAAAPKLRQLQNRLQNLADLASLCRFAALGDPRSVCRVRDEMQCLVVDFPDPLPAVPAGMSIGAWDARAQLAAAVDLFAGAAFVSACSGGQHKAFVAAVTRAIESAAAFPLAFAEEAAAYLGEGDGTLSPKQAALAIANATERLIQNDVHCAPMAPAWLRRRLEGLADRWLQKNPVSALLDALIDPKLAGAKATPGTAKTGDAVTLQWNADLGDGDGLFVMFSPHQPGKIRSLLSRSIEVEVPDGARSGPVAVVHKPAQATLDEIAALEKTFQDDYPTEWGLSLFSMIPLGNWAYPAAFCDAPTVQVVSLPRSASVAIFDASGQRAEGRKFGVGEEVILRYRVDPPGSDANAAPQVKATGGVVAIGPEPGTLHYRPTEPGRGSVQLAWDACDTISIPIDAILVWNLSPARLVLAPGGPAASLQIGINTPLAADLTFTLAGTTGNAVVPGSAVLSKGSKSVTVPVMLNPNGSPPALAQASDLIEITLGATRRRIELWIAQPQGRWNPPLADNRKGLSIVGVHAVVLRTGKVLYFSFDARAVNNKENFNKFFADPNLGSYQIWDPLSETAGPVQAIGRNVFCAGQCQLADGTIFTAGGQDGAGAADVTGAWDKLFAAYFGSDNGAHKDIHTYDPATDAWMRWPDMDDGRYYPTCQTLADGSPFVAGGLSNLQTFVLSGDNWCQNDQYEIYSGGALGLGPSPHKKFMSADQYPILRLMPGTRHLFVHIHNTTYLFDLNSGSFVPGAEFMPPAPVGRQTYPMQTGYVLLPQREGEAPRILIVGGSTHSNFDYNTQSDAPAVRGGFIFDYHLQNPAGSAWRPTQGSPTVARLLSDTVLLPDGSVFVVNGIGKGAASGHSSNTVFQADLFDPVSEMFLPMAPPDPDHPRAYHSTAVLLPDGRVAIAGNTGAYNNPDPGGPAPFDDTSIQIFNPPYLFLGPRPKVAGVPAAIAYGASATVNTTGDPIAKVMMMRPCAVTHSQDMDQRAIWLASNRGGGANGNARGGSVTFTVPSDPSLAPPGYYMLFFLSEAGVPSIASWIRLGGDAGDGGGGNGDSGGGGQSYPPVYLGTYENGANVVSVFDGDITLEKIDQHCNVQLESRHGSITINQKCDQHCTVILKAKTTVTIGEKIDQHCNVTIVCESDVTIGQKIDGNSQADITTSGGSIFIGQKIDGNSSAALKAPNGNIHIVQKVDGNSVVTWHALSFQCPNTGGAQVTHVP